MILFKTNVFGESMGRPQVWSEDSSPTLTAQCKSKFKATGLTHVDSYGMLTAPKIWRISFLFCLPPLGLEHTKETPLPCITTRLDQLLKFGQVGKFQ